MRKILTGILLCTCGCLAAQVYDPSGELLNNTLIDFETKSINDELIDTKKWRGDVIVLNFWFTGCAPCIKELRQLNNVATHYADKNVHFVAISWEKDTEMLRKFVTVKNMKYTVVANGKPIIDKYLLKLYPTNIVIDQEGVIRFIESGYYGNVEEKLLKAVGELVN